MERWVNQPLVPLFLVLLSPFITWNALPFLAGENILAEPPLFLFWIVVGAFGTLLVTLLLVPIYAILWGLAGAITWGMKESSATGRLWITALLVYCSWSVFLGFLRSGAIGL